MIAVCSQFAACNPHDTFISFMWLIGKITGVKPVVKEPYVNFYKVRILLRKMKGDYKVPPKLSEKIAAQYKRFIVIDDSGLLDYSDTLDAFAEEILKDYSYDRRKRLFGQEIYDPEEMSRWLQYNLPDLYEILLKMNNEL